MGRTGMDKNRRPFYSAALKLEMNSNRSVLRVRIPESTLVNRIMFGQLVKYFTGRKCSYNFAFVVANAKFFVNASIDTLFNLSRSTGWRRMQTTG